MYLTAHMCRHSLALSDGVNPQTHDNGHKRRLHFTLKIAPRIEDPSNDTLSMIPLVKSAPSNFEFCMECVCRRCIHEVLSVNISKLQCIATIDAASTQQAEHKHPSKCMCQLLLQEECSAKASAWHTVQASAGTPLTLA
jgi:hypothetical protein